MTDSHSTAAFDFRNASQPRTCIGTFRSGRWAPGFLLIGALLCPSLHLQAQKNPLDQNVFANKAGRTSFPFELSQGVIIVPVSIHESRPLRFALDSGSTRTLVERNLAASLGLKEGDASSLQGAGQGRISVHGLHDLDLQMPGLESTGYDGFTADLTPLEQSVGTRVDGILGYDFFARFVVTIDFEAKQMTVELPAAFYPSNAFEELALEIRGKWAFVKGELMFPGPVTIQDSFFIDSGSSDAVDHPVVKLIQSRMASTSGVGLGTPVEGAVAAATSFRIGTFTLMGPTVACCGATDAMSRMIGTEILRRFTVTFDYPSSRLFLRPNRTLHASFRSAPLVLK
jgi:Aspartyl protease